MNGGIVVSAELSGSGDGLNEPFPSNLSRLREDANTTAVSLFRVNLAVQDMCDAVFDRGINSCRPLNELLRVPLADELMGRREVLLWVVLSEFATIDPLNINAYAVQGRYLDSNLMPTAAEAKSYYQLALQVKTVVTERIVFP